MFLDLDPGFMGLVLKFLAGFLGFLFEVFADFMRIIRKVANRIFDLGPGALHGFARIVHRLVDRFFAAIGQNIESADRQGSADEKS